MANPRYFEYALMIERFGSFKRAAVELHVSQPALSKGIALLEEEYGVLIFDRVIRPLVPTEGGKLVLAEGLRVLEGSIALKKRLMQVQGLVDQTVKIGWGPYGSKVYGADFTKAYYHQFPNSELITYNSNWKALPRLLRKGIIDLYVGDISSPFVKQEFIVDSMHQESISFICTPDHPLASHQQLSLPEIYEHPLTLCSIPPWAKEWLQRYMLDHDNRESPTYLRVDDYRMIRDILIEEPSLGSLATHSCFEDEIKCGKLKAIPVVRSPTVCAGIVTLEATREVPMIRQVIEIIKDMSMQRHHHEI